MPVWAEMLREARRARSSMSQRELAARAEVSLRTVNSYERGMARPSRDTLLRLASALGLDRQTTNAMFSDAGFDPLPTGRLARFERRRTPYPVLQAEIARYSWPCLVLNDNMEILLWNAPAARVAELDFGAALPELAERNLMRIAALGHFRKRVLNWEQVVAVMIGVLKSDFEDAERYAELTPAFAALLQDLSSNPAYRDAFPRMMALWGQVPARDDIARTGFRVDWELSGGTVLAFNCVVAPWSEFDAFWSFDWQPADGATADWLLQGTAAAREHAHATDRGSAAQADATPDERGAASVPAWCALLRTTREQRGLTQAALGRAVNLSADTIFSYESGRRTPSREALLRLARALLLDDGTANFLLGELGYAPEPSDVVRSLAGLPSRQPRFWPGRWAERAGRTRTLVASSIADHPWPCLVLDGQCRILARNAPLERMLGPELVRPAAAGSGNLLQLLLSSPFREHVINYGEVVSALMPSGLKDLLINDGRAQNGEDFRALLTALNEHEPDVVRELETLWREQPLVRPSTRLTYPLVWRLDDGTVLSFNGVVSLWSDYLWYWALDWHPADAATWAWFGR